MILIKSSAEEHLHSYHENFSVTFMSSTAAPFFTLCNGKHIFNENKKNKYKCYNWRKYKSANDYNFLLFQTFKNIYGNFVGLFVLSLCLITFPLSYQYFLETVLTLVFNGNTLSDLQITAQKYKYSVSRLAEKT